MKEITFFLFFLPILATRSIEGKVNAFQDMPRRDRLINPKKQVKAYMYIHGHTTAKQRSLNYICIDNK
jgi:hypothetical protein